MSNKLIKYFGIKTLENKYNLSIEYKCFESVTLKNLEKSLNTSKMLSKQSIVSDVVYSYNLYFGGSQANKVAEGAKGCVEITIYNHNNLLNDPKYANIVNIHSEEGCNISSNLSKGVGTLHMINTALNVCIKMFPWVMFFTFSDTSTKECITKKPSSSVSLSAFMIALYGKTWYEKNFKATLLKQSEQIEYCQKLEKFNDSKLKNKISWELFYNRFIINFGRNSNIINIDIIYNLYINTKTFREFLDKLQFEIKDKQQLCLTLQPWIESFVLFLLGDGNLDTIASLNSTLSKQWIIDISGVSEIEFDKPGIVILDSIEYTGGNDSGYKIL